MAPGLGWLARVTSLVDRGTAAPMACAYADLAAGVHGFFSGDPTAAHPRYVTAVRAGQLLGDADVAAMGLLGCGQTELMLRRPEGMARLDEAMAAVTAGDVSPVATGLIYCAVIETCYEMCDLRRAQEWTNALTDWCAAQRDLVPFRGQCLVHRAQLLRLHGSWTDALDEAREAVRRLTQPPHPALGAAVYEEAELHRLRGDTRAAQQAYGRASDSGHGAEPGLALLLLTEGRAAAAAAAVDRALAEPQFPATRARLLSARVEALLAIDDVGGARAAADELATLDAELGSPPLLSAMANHAAGAVLLAEDDARAAVRRLRHAWTSWHEIDAPYETTRTRVLIGLACRGLGDDETGAMELTAAAPDVRPTRRDPRRRPRRRATDASAGAGRADGPRGRGARARRQGRHQPRHRRRARDQREDRRPPPQQHLHQARRLVPGRGDRLRLRAPPHVASSGPISG